MSQNPTLINGFEDVMNHIKQQEQRIKELEKKNEKWEKYVEEVKVSEECCVDENEQLQKYIKELEEFIKKKCESEWSGSRHETVVLNLI